MFWEGLVGLVKVITAGKLPPSSLTCGSTSEKWQGRLSWHGCFCRVLDGLRRYTPEEGESLASSQSSLQITSVSQWLLAASTVARVQCFLRKASKVAEDAAADMGRQVETEASVFGLLMLWSGVAMLPPLPVFCPAISLCFSASLS